MMPLVWALLVADDFGGPGGTPHGGYLRWRDQDMPAAVGAGSREFNLGDFVQILQKTKWVGFDVEITKAHRSPAGTNAMDEATLKADRGADVVGFRFNQSFSFGGQSRTLADYDTVLFFSVNPSNPNTALAPEAEAIAQFMEAGGGFFATGDRTSSRVTSRHLSLSIVCCVPVAADGPHTGTADSCAITDKVGSGALTALTHLAPCWPR